MCNNNRYTGRPTTILQVTAVQVRARKHAVHERGCGRAFALVREGDSDRGEQALHRGGASWAAEVLPRHINHHFGGSVHGDMPRPGPDPEASCCYGPLNVTVMMI